MYSAHTGFQRLRACAVGRSYPPQFYDWIKNVRLRNLFERIAEETEEDFLNLIKVLQNFGISVVRTNVPSSLNELGIMTIDSTKRIPGPISMVPRDELCMIGDKLYVFNLRDRLLAKHTIGLLSDYDIARIAGGPINHTDIAANISDDVKSKIAAIKGLPGFDSVTDYQRKSLDLVKIFQPIIDHVRDQGNEIIDEKIVEELPLLFPNGIIRLGQDLLFGVDELLIRPNTLEPLVKHFSEYHVKFVNSHGHVDGCLCVAKPGLLLSIRDIEDQQKSFPDWEICYLENQSWTKVDNWNKIKTKNAGKWWIPGHEQDDELIDFVETWLTDWVGYVEESVFDVNALVIDEKNILVTSYNKQAFSAFERHGITPHIVPFRHRFFWDGGLHCITLDLDREGDRLDYSLQR